MSNGFFLSEHAKHFDDFFSNEIEKESDRAVAVIAAALFDEVLLNLIKVRLVPNSSSSDELFDGPNAPFSTLSSKISGAYRVGSISRKMARDIHIIRKIRNQFAHNLTGCTFEDGAVRSRVIELVKGTKYNDESEQRLQNQDGPRGDFEFSCSWRLYSLHANLSDLVELEEAGDEFGYWIKDEPDIET